MKSFIKIIAAFVLLLTAASASTQLMLFIHPDQIDQLVNPKLSDGWKVIHQSIAYSDGNAYILVTLAPPTKEEYRALLEAREIEATDRAKAQEEEVRRKREERLRKYQEMQKTKVEGEQPSPTTK